MYGWPIARLRRRLSSLLQPAATQVLRDRPVGPAALPGGENALRLAPPGRGPGHPLRPQPLSRQGPLVDCRCREDVAPTLRHAGGPTGCRRAGAAAGRTATPPWPSPTPVVTGYLIGA